MPPPRLALHELSTTAAVAAELGVSASLVRRLAARHGLGWEVGAGQRVFTAADVAALRARKTQPGRVRRAR